MRRRVLILGGTGEAVDLAQRLESRAEFDVVTSLAGRTRRPAAIPGRVRTGGFGGVEGLTAYLAGEHVDVVVDATHPYAARISNHAKLACDVLGVPRVQLWRPAWTRVDGDEWTGVASLDAAADAVADARMSAGGCVFLTTGVRDVQAFSRLQEVRFLVRLVDTPRTPLPLSKSELIVDRGPFAIDNERALFLEHGVELLVSKNSGGVATWSKLTTARELGVPVVMVDRPDPESGDRAETAEDVLRWLTRNG